MTEPLMAAFEIDGETRFVCVGCTQRLLNFGALRLIRENLLPMKTVPEGSFSILVVELAAPFTLDNCQALVRDRHVGRPWGT